MSDDDKCPEMRAYLQRLAEHHEHVREALRLLAAVMAPGAKSEDVHRLALVRTNLPVTRAWVNQAGRAVDVAPRLAPRRLLLRARAMADQAQAAEAELAERLAAAPALPRNVIDSRENAFVCGAYNLRDGRGELYPWAKKSARELAVLILEAMHETAFAVDLPGTSFPAVEWDYVPAHEALSALASAHGAEVVYELDPPFVAVRMVEVPNG
jgi:hypothetical protein